MSEKQAIEVGQVWRSRQGNNYGRVDMVSPAWIRWNDGMEVHSIRRREFTSEFYLDDTSLTPIELDDIPADNTSTHAAMQAAVSAFNAQTGLKLSEHHGWLLLLNLELVQAVDPMEIHGKECFTLYQESREVD